MPVIKVWCLPQVEEEKLNALHKALVLAVSSVEELGVSDESDMTCLFPADMMKYGLGTEIIIEVTGLYDKPERTESVRQRLAQTLVGAVQGQFPYTKNIECFVVPFNPLQGFATSRPLADGTCVKTTKVNEAVISGWQIETLPTRKWGVSGTVLKHHTGHGLYYDVQHDDGTIGHYDPLELEVVYN